MVVLLPNFNSSFQLCHGKLCFAIQTADSTGHICITYTAEQAAYYLHQAYGVSLWTIRTALAHVFNYHTEVIATAACEMSYTQLLCR